MNKTMKKMGENGGKKIAENVEVEDGDEDKCGFDRYFSAFRRCVI